MKKPFLLILLLGCILTLSAQNTPPPATSSTPPPIVQVRKPYRTYRLGIALSSGLAWAGVANNNNNTPHASSTGVEIPFTYGLVLDYSFARNYSLYFNLNDAFTGGSLVYDNTVAFKSFPNETFGPGSKVTYKMQYIELPVSLKLKSNEINYITYFVQVGGEPDICISANANIKSAGGGNDVSKGNIYKDVTPIDFSLLFGAGIEYQLTESNNLVLSAGFHNSLIDFTRNRSGVNYDDTRTLLRRVSITAGIFF